MLKVRALVSWSMLFCFPFSMAAVEKPATAGAIVYAHGKVQINGSPNPGSMALFSGDAVQTEPDAVANITADGSSVLVMPNSAVKFEGAAVNLDHGDVVVSTSKRMALKADELTVLPATNKQAKFEVAENEDTVVIAARKGDLSVSDDQGTSTVPEGQQTTKTRKRKPGAAAPAKGGVMSGRTAAILAGGAGAGTLAAVLATSGSSKKCISPGTKNCSCGGQNQNQQGNNNCQ